MTDERKKGSLMIPAPTVPADVLEMLKRMLAEAEIEKTLTRIAADTGATLTRTDWRADCRVPGCCDWDGT